MTWTRFGIGLTWLCAVGSLLSCSSQRLSDDTPATPATPPTPITMTPITPLTLSDACDYLEQAACAAFERCSPETFGSRYPDTATCVTVRAADCVERRSAPGNTVTPVQVEACADATRNPTCSVVMANEFGVAAQRSPACVWQGALPDGEACITASQCASGTCAVYDRDACGTCVTRADADCVTDAECLVGSRCRSGRCVAANKLGEACGGLDFCSAELTCRAGQCAVPGQTGDACGGASGGCAPSLWCNGQAGQCEHSTLLSGIGTCGTTPSGGNALCPAGSLCLPDAAGGGNQCAPAGAEGAPCSYQPECGVGLNCYESSCVKLLASACAAPDTTPSPQYPAQLPSFPQCTAPAAAALLAKPKAVLITFAGDPRANSLETFVQALGASTYWQSTTSEYGIAELSALPPIRVQESPPAQLSDAAVQKWLADKLAKDTRFPPSDGLTVYVLHYPASVSIAVPIPGSAVSRSCADFDGYHSSVSAADGSAIPYAVIPECVYGDAEAALSHELVEAASDPFASVTFSGSSVGSGYSTMDSDHWVWSLPSAGMAELADLCEWQPLVDYSDPGVGGTVQRTWSNAAMAGFHQPCVPAPTGVAYFNSVPHFDDAVSVQIFGRSVQTRGISLPLGGSKTVPVDLLSDGPTGGPWRVSAYDLKEWTHRFDYHAQVEPTLVFAFDQHSGVNGDTVHMTVTALKQDADFKAEPFVLVSRRGRNTNLWLGLAGQP